MQWRAGVLEEFPDGVFRRLAQNRLAVLRSPAAGSDRTCADQSAGTACWSEIAGQPGCYVWNSGIAFGATVTWTGECAGDRAQGAGSLTWVRGVTERVATGRLQAGEMTGHWVFRFSSGMVAEGPFVDGKENGHWVTRFANGSSRKVSLWTASSTATGSQVRIPPGVPLYLPDGPAWTCVLWSRSGIGLSGSQPTSWRVDGVRPPVSQCMTWSRYGFGRNWRGGSTR